MSTELDYLWEKNVNAGYDPEQKKWRLARGQFCKRQEALGERHPDAVYGGTIRFDMAPLSKKLDQLQMVLGGLTYQKLQQLDQLKADHMPMEILAAMRLSEHYTRLEGDVWQTVLVPIQLALRDVEITSEDKGVEKELQEIYDSIDLNQVLLWLWLCTEMYGQGFPLEVWDEKGENIEGIVVLDPKYMKVGKQISLAHSLSITTPDGVENWDATALKEQIHPMVYHSFASGWNEQAVQGAEIPLNPDRCHAVFDMKLPFQRYAIPPLSRAFRPLSTRQVYEEMQRATMEGFRNQLWVFKLVNHDGTAAPPGAISHFKSQMGGMIGERTGYVVWGGTDLIVEQHAPQSLDALMGNEHWLYLTLHIFRQRGLSLKLVTGEAPQSGRAGDVEWETRLLMDRMAFQRNQLLRFERHLRKSIAKSRGKAWGKANINVMMVRPDYELQVLVERELQPLGQAGWLSLQTILQKGGYDYNIELERKKDEEPVAHLFAPKPTFAQATTFNAPKETQEAPTGRPKGTKETEPRKKSKPKAGGVKQTVEPGKTLRGHLMEDDRFDAYVTRIMTLFNTLTASPTTEGVDWFIDGMKGVNVTEMMSFAREGYLAAGGAHAVDPGWIKGAIHFVNGYADGFRQDLHDAVGAELDLETFRWRTFLYPQEGRHLSYMWGAQQAMREWGAQGWRRILHPEQSEDGPCTACIADSQIIHPITEGFFEFHPNGVCTAQSIGYYTSTSQVPVEIPLPRKYIAPEVIRERLTELGLGPIGKAVVRRLRTE